MTWNTSQILHTYRKLSASPYPFAFYFNYNVQRPYRYALNKVTIKFNEEVKNDIIYRVFNKSSSWNKSKLKKLCYIFYACLTIKFWNSSKVWTLRNDILYIFFSNICCTHILNSFSFVPVKWSILVLVRWQLRWKRPKPKLIFLATRSSYRPMSPPKGLHQLLRQPPGNWMTSWPPCPILRLAYFIQCL